MAYVYNINTKHRHYTTPYLWSGILFFTLIFLGCVEATDSNLTGASVVVAEQGEGCTKNLTIDGSNEFGRRPVQLDVASLSPLNGSSITCNVTANCPGRVHIMLQTSRFPFSNVTDIFIEMTSNSTVSPTLSVRKCGTSCPSLPTTDSSSRSCGRKENDFGRFRVSWKGGVVNASREVNGEVTYADPVNLNGQSPWVYGVFLDYELFDYENDDEGDDGSAGANAVSNWKIDVLCEEAKESVAAIDHSSMVTEGHLAGSVIAALLFGILFGALCVYFGPRVITCIRDDLLARLPKRGRKKTADTEAALGNQELDTLVGADSPFPDQPATKLTVNPSTQKAAVPELPGDSVSAGTPTSRRKAPPNSYTTHVLNSEGTPPGTDSSSTTTQPPRKGSRAAAADITTAQGAGSVGGPRKGSREAAADVTTAQGAGSGGGGPRKGSGPGRLPKSPLPALPGDDVKDDGKKPHVSKKKSKAGAGAGAGAAVGSGLGGKAKAAAESPQPDEEEECYINAETNVYEGLKHEAPIYENRNAGEYECLRPGQPHGNAPANRPSKKSKRK